MADENELKLIDEYSKKEDTKNKKAQIEFVKEHHKPVNSIADKALDAVYNKHDVDLNLTFHLLSAALELTNAANKKTLMLKHTEAAVAVYDQLAEDLANDVDSVNLKGLRQFAKDKGIEAISPKAIEAVLNKEDPIGTMAVWNATILLHKQNAINNTKTLKLVYAEAAKRMCTGLKHALDIDVADDDEMKTD